MKKILKLISFVLLAGIIMWACKDSFSEEDFIKSQLDLKNKQDSVTIAKMNEAGQLLSYTIQVLEDKVPVADVDVVMSNPPEGTTATTATTDANGFATFTSVRMGSNTFVISKTGYYSATFIVNFGTPSQGTNYTIVNNTIVPIKVNASNQVPIFASAGTGETGVIKGVVTIETDLTNQTPEIPQGLTLKANMVGVNNFIGGGANQTSNGTATLVQYYFNSNGVGSATVDNTTGAYTMTLPASADGRSYNLIYPVISTTQKVGYTRLNGVTIAPLVSSTVPAVYGPFGYVPSYDAVPSIPGAVATFAPAAPAPAGQGVKFNFAAYPRSLATGIIFSYASSNSTTFGNGTWQLSNRGSGYNTAPSVTVTGGGASTQATMSAAIYGTLATMGIMTAGTGYTGNVNFKLQISNDNGTNYYDAYDINFDQINFTKDVGGTATGLSAVTLPTTGSGIDAPFSAINTGAVWGPSLAYGITNYKWVITGNGTGAVGTPTLNCSIERLKFETGGTGYTSAPTITISAPAAGTQATVLVIEFNTQWAITIDNSGNTTPYKVSPSNVNLIFSINNNTTQNSTILDQFGGAFLLNSTLTPSGGDLIFADGTKTYRTVQMSQNAPVAQIVPNIPAIASATVAIGSNLGAANFGLVTGLNSVNNGSGYDAPLTVAIAPLTGLSGSGAKVDLTNSITFNSTTKAYSWSGLSVITNNGSGYQPFANMYSYYGPYSLLGITPGSTSAVQFSGGTSFTLRSGDVIVNNVNYGTGAKQISVN